MKISVCIPVYNFDVRELVNSLLQEIEEHKLDAEVLLIDDASDEIFKTINSQIKYKIENFIFLDENVGRSLIRNTFLYYAKGDYLLFLDCDVSLKENKTLILTYLDSIVKNPLVRVFYGGFMPDNAKNLRNVFSKRRELPQNYKREDILQLKTANFLIERKTFEQYQFDDFLKNYGYEDFLLAQKLKLCNVSFLYIQNPVIHSDNESTEQFLSKIHVSLQTLQDLSKNSEQEKLIQDITVYKIAKHFKKLGLSNIFSKIFRLFEKPIIKNLVSEKPSLLLFDIYKLAHLCKIL